ncbi:MAG TPA: peptide chain release factor 2 [Deltaproteobacteria bacterium]|nr:peptide chain release factor 2 [Deltaproteobacteria bacterium]HIA57816.1 peptide chain release factor 2 [Candidatus Lambdaproteobacteria bacterium]HIB94711.1 peptide chain release factor 2 [Candidatus Lambdaproteobacteria bacterium]HIN46866.1 peptide chain release factor 2 [Deltaproteobacteria bacterium]HIO11717.1 peptide chain release factor 2 [Deltaproteobacteria bacterium]
MLSEEISARIDGLTQRLGDLKGFFEVSAKQKQVDDLEQETSLDGFWELPQEERTVLLKNIARLSDSIQGWRKLDSLHDDLKAAAELYREEEDTDLLKEILDSCEKLDSDLDSLEIKGLFNGDADDRNAIVSIHPGAGGTESTDWASMIYEMYRKWLAEEGFKFQLLDYQPGDEAGIKSVTFSVTGPYAYGNLKTEIGVHRLVRISPFDSQKRRHTSFASVFVYAEIDEDVEVEINIDDIRVDTYRASGAGGQHVNTTDSAVRITHAPSGIVVQCQNERSQHKNKATAMKMLKAQLFDLQQKELNKEKDLENSKKQENAWGSQIRSYVLHPYQMVKDHRTNWEAGNTRAVLNGDINGFIKAALSQKVC